MIGPGCRPLVLLVLLVVTGGLGAKDAEPYRFVPRGKGRDDSARLQALLDEGVRWIQVAGPDIQLDVPVLLGMPSRTDPLQMQAYHGFTFEPAKGIDRVTVHSALGYDLNNPTNPSYAVFEWNGGYLPAGRLADQAVPGDRAIRVDVPQHYQVGDYIYISDTSLNPEWGYPVDGSLEVRQVVSLEGDRLKLDRPLRRPHLSYAPLPGSNEVVRPVVALCHPIFNVRMRRLTFSGFANIGIHMHTAWGAQLEDIDTRDWKGGTLILMDTGGGRNLIRNVSYRADRTGGGQAFFGWGLAVEGQEDTVIQNAVVSGAQTGLLINYSLNTWGVEVHCTGNEVNFNIGTDIAGNPSMHCGLRSCRSEASSRIGVSLGEQSYACGIFDQSFRNETGFCVEVGANGRGTELDGRVGSPLEAGAGIVSLGENSETLIQRRLLGRRKPGSVIRTSNQSHYRIIDTSEPSTPKGKP